ncbi:MULTISPECIES: hypothetical protein [unclassified Thermococcus]|nr:MULTISPECIES: hypothetical protein [unclassified Thermococcus]
MDVLLIPRLAIAAAFGLVLAYLAYDALSAWWWAREHSRRWVK